MNQATSADSGYRASVLVVEDELPLQELLQVSLRREGHEVRIAKSGEEGLQIATGSPPDLVLLDLMLPGMDGLEVCRRLRNNAGTAGTPIVIVSARGEEADVVAGLELGADDYIVKPFSPRVLAARIKAVLRRRETAEADATNVLSIHGITIDRDRHEVRVDDKPVDLTATEFSLLDLLASKPGRVFTRQQIINHIHGPAVAVTDRSVDVQVVGLRRKLGPSGRDVQTVRGVGYRFRE